MFSFTGMESFATSAVFVDDAEPDQATLADLESFEGLDELANLEGFDPGLLDGASDPDAPVPGPDDGDDPTPPAMVRWGGVETKNNDWMTWWWDTDRTALRRREEKVLEQGDVYTLQTVDHGQVVAYEGDRPVETAKSGISRIGTHSKYGFSDLRMKPVEPRSDGRQMSVEEAPIPS